LFDSFMKKPVPSTLTSDRMSSAIAETVKSSADPRIMVPIRRILFIPFLSSVGEVPQAGFWHPPQHSARTRSRLRLTASRDVHPSPARETSHRVNQTAVHVCLLQRMIRGYSVCFAEEGAGPKLGAFCDWR